MKHKVLPIFMLFAFIPSLQMQAEKQQSFSKAEVAKHSERSDCWIIVDDTVYNITPAVKDHDRYKYPLDSWCGKEASQAWETKDGKNKPHSRKAQIMLKGLSLGPLADP